MLPLLLLNIAVPNPTCSKCKIRGNISAADYIKAVNPSAWIDYAMITHFHDDHFGGMYKGAKAAASGQYYLTGITGVGDRIPIHQLVDRGYPDYN
ncbi:hypothetical protein F0L74_13815 [Chitinophaga agrisoli]|uniref:Metallo-beta-lactamase superfamily protein n=1 Tax=Chitinophaga agrisoli TaxID=2607653 RepID=A0A5B2VXM3_9BACT|nr:hypothetical protein [Chitinophaga agrisoli]KAA2243564.1 hypothetical protein F0L74_13815 [Chitinophaga agrisoli]